MVRRFDEPWGMSRGVERDVRRPSPARMYDWFLGGKDNFAADREAARKVRAAAPSIVRAARDNRAFMQRAVAWCAQVGIEQILDVGTGIPTPPNVAEVAHRFYPGTVVVGVDNDPEVLMHDRALLGGLPIVEGDIREPGRLLAEVDARGLIDWAQPVAVLLVAVLHFVSDEHDPAGLVAAVVERLAPGSAVVISHVCSTGADPRAVAEIEAVYADSTAPGSRFRTQEEIGALLGGLRWCRRGWFRCSTGRFGGGR